MKPLPSHQKNCFDVFRILAAFLVLYSHHFALSGKMEPSFLGLESFGGLAVVIFFGISGYLIAQSGMRSGSFFSFMEKRIKRIFPALVVCSLILYGIVGFFLQPESVFSKRSLLAVINLVALRGADPIGMAQDYIYPNAINGSLWTLPLEFSCYLILGIAFCFVKNIKPVLIILLTMIVLSIYFLSKPTTIGFYSISLQLFTPRAVSFFLGALMALSETSWNKKNTKTFIFFSGAILLYALKGSYDIRVLGYIIIPALVIIAGSSLTDRLIYGRFDYSYGVYIYAFPVQQIIINNTALGFYSSMFISAGITLLLGALSWHIVERPFLRRKPLPTTAPQFNPQEMAMK
ncbi:acyltransferase 3 [Serratia sp. AS12]|uniref:acyltransferase family protein n=1 Tax=Serratia TaxID=613 RepID=UPI00020E915B|nr:MULTISPECIES: acyltransferase [Serratia]AEF44711.1 acyltransferase 3 [Serratia plymuthica AS9]AEF49663.1 acyltransferase 3 [Serratia sp. AS12]AEG27370.1 acyltransferase 3 [Serratia sp. AS13]